MDTFSLPPSGALALDGTPAEARPVGLLGSVLRREAAIAALKTAVQAAPPPPGRERSKLLRSVAYSIHEWREATADAVELLAARPAHAARFYWNGMDLALKMLTDVLWAPLPQTIDPLLCKWFDHWTVVWLSNSKRGSRETQSLLALFAPGAALKQRCRRAEKQLLKLAVGASTEGAGMGGWAKQSVEQRADTLRVVQAHRLAASYAEGGANHAQRRRFGNFEQLLYGREGVHMKHLEALHERHVLLEHRSALVVQSTWRLYCALRRMRDQATDAVENDRQVALRVRADLARQTRDSMAKQGLGVGPPAADDGRRDKLQKGATAPSVLARDERAEGGGSPGKMSDKAIAEAAKKAAELTAAAYDPEKKLDRSFLHSMAASVEMPEMS